MSIPSAVSATKLYQNGLVWPRCTKTPFVFIGPTIQSVESFSHHVELRLAIPLEDTGIALTKHQGYEVVCNSSGTEARCEGVTIMPRAA
jgi:hypothetical protein